MPTIHNWRIKRSGAGMRIRGVCYDDGVRAEVTLTNVQAVETAAGLIYGVRNGERVCILK